MTTELRPPDLSAVMATLVPRRHAMYPEQIVVEPTAYCNLRCPMCPYPVMQREKGTLDMETFKRLADDVAARAPETKLWFAFLGEPLSLGKRLFDFIAYATSVGIRHTNLNTNVTRFMTDEAIEGILMSGLETIYLSMDAITQETYNRVRTGGNLEQTIEGCLRLIKRFRNESREKPRMVVQFIEMDENRHEREEFVRFWLGRGIEVKVRYKLSWGPFSGIQAGHQIETLTTERIPCSWLIRTVIVLWDGTVIQCDSDHEARWPAGNINRQTMYEIWNGELAKRREMHWNRDFSSELCRNCHDWRAGLSQVFKPGSDLAETEQEA